MSPRVFASVFGVEARRRMGYRADFWIQSLVGFLAEFGVVWFLWDALYRESGKGSLEGYDFRAMVLYQASILLLGKLVRGPEFEGAISNDVYDGSLSRYLLYPTPYFGFKYAQHLGSMAPALLQAVLFGAWFPLFFGWPEGASLFAALGAAVAVLGANLLYFLLAYPLQGVAFWAENVWSLTVAQRLVASLLGGVLLPLALFPPAARGALWFTPFPYLFAFPVETLFGRVGLLEWLRGMAAQGLWCLVFACVGRAVFRRGEMRYSGVGM
jgi:ABC-2 type transport system permease protein